MARGLLLGALTVGVAALFVPLSGVQWLALFGLSALVTYVFALLGVLIGVWAQNFEQVNIIPTFILLPMTFLGGIFYEVGRLPPPFDSLSLFNPVVFMVEALRGAVSGRMSSHAWAGLGILLLLSALFSLMSLLYMRQSHKLRG
jgi:ABC-2 type transport system permease protein